LNSEVTNLLGFHADSQNSIAPIKLSISQLTTLRWSLSDEVMQLKQAGFDAIGLWRPKLSQFGEQRSAEALTRARLEVSSLSFAGGFTGGCGFSYVEAVADGRLAIEQARTVGARTVVVVGGSTNGHTVRHSHRLVRDGLKELRDSAEQAQVTLSVLPMHQIFSRRWTFLNSLDQALDLLAEIDHPLIGLAFDAYHLWDEPRLMERIPEIVQLTNIVQLSDRRRSPQSEQDRLMPGEGTIPLTELIHAFQTNGYSGHFDIQVWSGNVWRSNYTHLIEQSHAAVKAMSLVSVK
jgi:sugar phosphate isomerase/epimerase